MKSMRYGREENSLTSTNETPINIIIIDGDVIVASVSNCNMPTASTPIISETGTPMIYYIPEIADTSRQP